MYSFCVFPNGSLCISVPFTKSVHLLQSYIILSKTLNDSNGLPTFYIIIIIIIIIIMSILPKGRSFTANSGTKAAVLLKGRSSTENSGTQAAVLLGMDRCGSLPNCFPHPAFSLTSGQTLKDLKRSQGDKRGREESGFG